MLKNRVLLGLVLLVSAQSHLSAGYFNTLPKKFAPIAMSGLVFYSATYSQTYRDTQSAYAEIFTPYQNTHDVWRRCEKFPWQTYEQGCGKYYALLGINQRNGYGKTLLDSVTKEHARDKAQGYRISQSELDKLKTIKALGAKTTQQMWQQDNNA